MAWLRAVVLFALLVAVPLLVEGLVGRHPRISVDRVKLSETFWRDVLSYSGYGLVLLLVLGFALGWLLFIPTAWRISDWLTLAERELNSLLRAWGGGYEKRKDVAKERAEWLLMLPDTDDPAPFANVYQKFFDLNQDDLKSGGSQGTAMGKVRLTAFLLREIYEGNIKNAQHKIFNEVKSGNKDPYIAPGIRQIVGYDARFKPNIEPSDPDYDKYEYGFPKDAGEDWFPVVMTVKMYRHPRNIVMIRADKTPVYDWDVIEELNVQAAPASDEPAVPVSWLRWLEGRDLAPLFWRGLGYLVLVALTVFVLWRLLA